MVHLWVTNSVGEAVSSYWKTDYDDGNEEIETSPKLHRTRIYSSRRGLRHLACLSCLQLALAILLFLSVLFTMIRAVSGWHR